MTLRHIWRTTAAVAAVAALAACESEKTLAVEELDQPDVDRAFATAEGVQAILSNGFSQILGATHATAGSVQPAAASFSFESYGTVANFGMTLRATIPRTPIDNTPGNVTQAENFRDFSQQSLRGRTIANAITALDRIIAGGGSTGSAASNARARSFGFFALGLANGQMAMVYDSVGVSRPGMASDEIPPLTDYQESMVAALAQLDSAIRIATEAQTAGASFEIPNEWLRTGGATTMADYLRILRSTKARLRAGVARNPAERAAVDWNLVVADAEAGITSNVTLELNAGLGWSNDWLNNAMRFEGWHLMTPYIMGMADTSAGYATWIATPRGTRVNFLIHSPDERFPEGATRADQQAASPPGTDELPDIYFRNRPAGSDTPGEAWGTSNYDHIRFRSYRTNASIGPWVWMDADEIAMLRAEGLIRLGRASEAVPLINASRVQHGLPEFPAGSTADTRAPAQPDGSSVSCVPRTPTASDGGLECGTLLEAMKWEKRMETAFTGYLQWYIDSRGWGDLVENTPLMWPVPFYEMQARRQSYLAASGSTDEWAAGPSTYGFGTGTR